MTVKVIDYRNDYMSDAAPNDPGVVIPSAADGWGAVLVAFRAADGGWEYQFRTSPIVRADGTGSGFVGQGFTPSRQGLYDLLRSCVEKVAR